MRKFIQIIEGFARSNIPDAVEEKYSHGDCVWLALAMNKHFGWPIMAQMERRDGREYVAHAYCIMPDGREIDILGPQTKVDIWTSDYQLWAPQAFFSHLMAERKANDRAMGRRATNMHAWVDEKLEQATSDMKRYVLPAIPSNLKKAA